MCGLLSFLIHFFILLFYTFSGKGGHAGKRAGCLSLERFLEFCSSNWPTPLLFRSFPLKLYTTSFTLWPRIHIDIYIYSIYIYTRTEQPSRDCWLDCIVQTLGYLSSVRLIDCHRCHRPISSVLFWPKLSLLLLYTSLALSLSILSLSLSHCVWWKHIRLMDDELPKVLWFLKYNKDITGSYRARIANSTYCTTFKKRLSSL